jgi:hypothetical protein
LLVSPEPKNSSNFFQHPLAILATIDFHRVGSKASSIRTVPCDVNAWPHWDHLDDILG